MTTERPGRGPRPARLGRAVVTGLAAGGVLGGTVALVQTAAANTAGSDGVVGTAGRVDPPAGVTPFTIVVHVPAPAAAPVADVVPTPRAVRPAPTAPVTTPVARSSRS